ncbi:hypothetical protein OPAG_04488 [Rhodococcus opacus PD630]|nr:hypothetical protein Pd630_LPD02438 [Rhodococcus opacus PD630]EHI45992.1 hypothetical protein OPAG_04488 [Rhodococcus opacus PD630]
MAGPLFLRTRFGSVPHFGDSRHPRSPFTPHTAPDPVSILALDRETIEFRPVSGTARAAGRLDAIA